MLVIAVLAGLAVLGEGVRLLGYDQESRIKIPYRAPASDCPEGWVPGRRSGLCYTIPPEHRGTHNFYQANKACGGIAGRLPAFRSAEELSEFQSIVNELMGQEEYSQVWIGCSDAVREGYYTCPAVPNPFFRWAPYNNEPNGGVQQNCVIGLRWPKGLPFDNLDVQCSSRHEYRVTACVTEPCPRQPWSPWSACTVSCGVGGAQRVSRMPGCPAQSGTCSASACPRENAVYANIALRSAQPKSRYQESPALLSRRTTYARFSHESIHGPQGSAYRPRQLPSAARPSLQPRSRPSLGGRYAARPTPLPVSALYRGYRQPQPRWGQRQPGTYSYT